MPQRARVVGMKTRTRNHRDTKILSESLVRSRRVDYTEKLITVNKCWGTLSAEITELSRSSQPLQRPGKFVRNHIEVLHLLQNKHKII